MILFSYLLEASVCMALFYVLYAILFKRFTFFTINRFYLLFVVAASLSIPAIHIKITEPLPVQHADKTVIGIQNGGFEPEHLAHAAKQAFNLNWVQIAEIIYSVICAALLIKLIYGIFKILRQAKLHGVTVGNHCIVQHAGNNYASFFHIIFLRENIEDTLELEQVLAHEKAHAQLLHSADIVCIEVVKAICWFNPFIYLIGAALKEVHEYEVDQSLKSAFNPKQYASLLVKLLTVPAVGLTNQFSAYSLKARVVMLFKPTSSAYKKWCYLITLPVMLLTGYWFSVEKVYGTALLKKDFVLVLDAGHGGSQRGAQGAGGYYEKDLNLQLVKQIELEAAERGIRTKLTRTDDSYLDIRDRASNEGNAFISIHLNSPNAYSPQHNGTLINIDRNAFYPLSKKLALSVNNALNQLDGINHNKQINIRETTSVNHLGILSRNKAPAILAEVGYMTDKGDLNYFLNKQNQHKVAVKIIDAVVAYANEN